MGKRFAGNRVLMLYFLKHPCQKHAIYLKIKR